MPETWLVCGGRKFADRTFLQQNLDALVVVRGSPTRVISGGAPGADTEALVWARSRGYPLRVYVADWTTHGRAAGAIRNQQMLDEGRPDVVIAFDGGPGTADMVRRTNKAGIKLYVFASKPS